MKVCYTCQAGTRAESDIGIWMIEVRNFWARRPWLRHIYEFSFPFLLILSIGMALHYPTRELSVIPFSLMAIIYLTGEHVPLSPMPHSSINALSVPKYVGLMRVVTTCIMMVVFYGLLIELIAPSTKDEFTRRVLNVMLFTVPITGLLFLSVKSRPAFSVI